MRQHAAHWWQDMQPIIRSRNQQALIAQACIFPLRFSCFTTVVALHASTTFGAGPTDIGMMFTALALSQGLGMPIGAWLADKSTGARKGLVIPAGLLSAASLGMMAMATEDTHFIAAMACQGAAWAFVRMAPSAADMGVLSTVSSFWMSA